MFFAKKQAWNNWWENHSCKPEEYSKPKSLEEIIELVRWAKTHQKKIKVVGSGHSWSDIPCTDGYMISLDRLDRVLEIDVEKKTITVQSGIRIYQLNRILSEQGLALPSLGSIAEQSIAGAIATGTHGASIYHGGIASSILELELVDGIGQAIRCSKTENSDIFSAALIGIGAIGIVTQVKIQCCGQFWLTEQLECWDIKDVIANLDAFSKKDYFRFWYTTTQQDAIVQTFSHQKKPSVDIQSPHWFQRISHQVLWYLWIYRYYTFKKHQLKPFTRTDKSQRIFCYSRVLLRLYKLSFSVTKACTGVLFSEYGIPAENASIAMENILGLLRREEIKGHLRFEVRFGAAEEIWLSSAYQRPTCYIQIIFEKKHFNTPEEQYNAFCKVENIMKAFKGRPHWAKDHFYTDDDLRSVYPRWEAFLQIRKKLDPFQCFTNKYLSRIFSKGRRKE